jgi:hypothetical protein
VSVSAIRSQVHPDASESPVSGVDPSIDHKNDDLRQRVVSGQAVADVG